MRWNARSPHQPASSKSAAREPLVVSDPQRARCVWLGTPSEKKTKPIPVSVDPSTKVGPAPGGPQGRPGAPAATGRSTRVLGRPRCRGAWGSIRGHPGPRGHRSGGGRSRPNTSSSGALRDRRVRSQPGPHRPGSPQPATDPDSLYLRNAAKAADSRNPPRRVPGGAGWFGSGARAPLGGRDGNRTVSVGRGRALRSGR